MASLKRIFASAFSAGVVWVSPISASAAPEYVNFRPTGAELETVLSATYQRCKTLAGVNSFGAQDCADNEIRRLNRELDQSYRTVFQSVSGADAAALRVAHRRWERTRDADCMSKINPSRRQLDVGLSAFQQQSDAYQLAFFKCRLEEVQRRTAWFALQR